MSPFRCSVHKYRKFRNNPGQKKTDTWRCINCSHYVNGWQMVVGRDSICWNCGKTFTMTINSLQLKPHCGCKNKVMKDSEKDNLLNLLMEKL